MSGKQRRRILQGSFWLSGFAAALFAGGLPVTTTFTYQGTLLDEGVIPTGSYDFVVSLFDSPTDPAAITSPRAGPAGTDAGDWPAAVAASAAMPTRPPTIR